MSRPHPTSLRAEQLSDFETCMGRSHTVEQHVFEQHGFEQHGFEQHGFEQHR